MITIDEFIRGFLYPVPLFQNPREERRAQLAEMSQRGLEDLLSEESEFNQCHEERRKLLSDVLSTSKLKAYEIRQIFLRFKQFDSTGTNRIGYSDFLSAIDRRDNESTRRLFRLCDRNRDGTVDLKEFIVGLSQFSSDAPVEDKIFFAFKLFDDDNNGYIDRSELVGIIRSTCPPSVGDEWIRNRVDRIYDDLNIPPNTLIDFELFLKFASIHPNLISPALKAIEYNQ